MKGFLSMFLLLCSGFIYGQDVQIINASFEDVPKKGNSGPISIKDWIDCGVLRFPEESPPDIHPGKDIFGKGFWENDLPASDGRTYLGMVVRDNDTWEAVSQRLNTPLLKGKCYNFSLELATSEKYISGSRKEQEENSSIPEIIRPSASVVNYTNGIVLRIVGGAGYCNEREILLESPVVTHKSWKTYEFSFESTFEHQYITVEAYYKTPTLLPYNGHILVDNMSNFEMIPCDDEEVQLALAQKKAKEESDKLPPHKRARIEQARKKTQEQMEVAADPTMEKKPAVKNKILTELNKKLTEGTTIEITDLYFEADSANIEEESFPVLDELVTFLKSREDVSVEIGGHTNTAPSHEFCDKLSTRRAKAVYNYLRQNGVSTSQLEFRGYGKRRRKVQIERTAADMKKNQRVEIKIIKVS